MSELKLANEEHSTRMEKFAALKRTALDRTLDKETRLRAVMQIDALIWARRSVITEYQADTPDKITTAKREADRRRLVRWRSARIARGLPTRPRRLIGAWRSTEQPDTLASPPPGVCIVCGKGFDTLARTRSRTCSRQCTRTAYRARVGHG